MSAWGTHLHSALAALLVPVAGAPRLFLCVSLLLRQLLINLERHFNSQTDSLLVLVLFFVVAGTKTDTFFQRVPLTCLIDLPKFVSSSILLIFRWRGARRRGPYGTWGCTGTGGF